MQYRQYKDGYFPSVVILAERLELGYCDVIIGGAPQAGRGTDYDGIAICVDQKNLESIPGS